MLGVRSRRAEGLRKRIAACMKINTCGSCIGDVNAKEHGHVTVFRGVGDHRPIKIRRLFAAFGQLTQAGYRLMVSQVEGAETAMKYTHCLRSVCGCAKGNARLAAGIIQLYNSFSGRRFHCQNSHIQPQGVTPILIGICRLLFRKTDTPRWIYAYHGSEKGILSGWNVILVTFQACMANFRDEDIESRGIGY